MITGWSIDPGMLVVHQPLPLGRRRLCRQCARGWLALWDRCLWLVVNDPGWGQRDDHGMVNRPRQAGGAPALFTICDGCEGTGQNGLVRRHWSKNRAYPHHGSGRKGVGPPPNTKQGHMRVGLRPEALGNRQLNSTGNAGGRGVFGGHSVTVSGQPLSVVGVHCPWRRANGRLGVCRAALGNSCTTTLIAVNHLLTHLATGPGLCGLGSLALCLWAHRLLRRHMRCRRLRRCCPGLPHDTRRSRVC